jgi:miniconductance mechanosensitive channel
MRDTLIRYLKAYGFNEADTVLIYTLAAAVLAIVLIVIVEVVMKRILLRIVHRLAEKTSTRLDDFLVKHKVFSGLAQLLPPVLLHLLAVPVLQYYPEVISLVKDVAVLYLTVAIILLCFSALNAMFEYYAGHPVASKLPVKSFIQVLKTVIVFIGLIFMVSKLLGKSPVVFFSGLGAFTAVLLLIFKDSILGLVAGIQLSSNNLVRVGDSIEMTKYDADGEVIDISLVTVSVQNGDKSIVAIPAYSLISEGFKNWRGMTESEGRRIKRSIYIDMTSIRFCDEVMLLRLDEILLLREYLRSRLDEIGKYNQMKGFDGNSPVNGRRLTNLGTFRAYLTAYIQSLPQINAGMTVLVRYLQPTENGLPLEIYGFSSNKTWVSYESLQADIMDHVIAVLPYFDLRVFQLQGAAGPAAAGVFPADASGKQIPQEVQS